MMKQRAAILFLAALLCAGLSAGWACAAFGGTTGDLTWSLDENGTLTITGKGSMPDYYPSVELRPPWFGSRDAIRAVVVEESVENIGAYAFANCGSLEQLSLPESLRRIGESAFYISGLNTVEVPVGVKAIESGAFQECEDLKEIKVSADNSSFSDRDGILFDRSQNTLLFCPKGKQAEVRLPASLKRIARCALIDCLDLTEVLFEGTPEQWQAVTVDEGNDPLQRAEVRYVEPIVQRPEIRKLDLTDVRVEYTSAPGYLWEDSLGVQSIHATVTGPCGQCYIRIADVSDSKPTEEEAWNTAEEAVQAWKSEGKPFTRMTPYSFGKSRPIYAADLNKTQFVLLAGQDENGDLAGYGIVETPPVSDKTNGAVKQGTLSAQDGSGTLTWSLQNSGTEKTLLIKGDMTSDRPVFSAVYDGRGKMLSVDRLIREGSVEIVRGDTVKLFWLSADTGAPKSGCAEIPLTEKDP